MTNESPASDSAPKSKMPLTIATIALVGWMLTLAGFSQTPRLYVVNHVQVRRADRVVTGLVTDRAKKLVEIKRVWSGKEPDTNSIEIPNLDAVEGIDIEQGEQYLIPLWDDGRIVKVRKRQKLEDNRPTVYPDTEEMRQQVVEAIERGPLRD